MPAAPAAVPGGGTAAPAAAAAGSGGAPTAPAAAAAYATYARCSLERSHSGLMRYVALCGTGPGFAPADEGVAAPCARFRIAGDHPGVAALPLAFAGPPLGDHLTSGVLGDAPEGSADQAFPLPLPVSYQGAGAQGLTALYPTMPCWPRMKASTASEGGSAGGMTGFSLAGLWASKRAAPRRAARWAAARRAACSCAAWALLIPSWSCGDAAPAE